MSTAHIKWYQYNGSAYAEVTDTTLLDDLVGRFGFSMAGDEGGATGVERYDTMSITSFGTTSIDVSNFMGHGPFYYNYNLTTKDKLHYVGIDYMFGGQNFRFAWVRYLTP